MRMLDSGTAAMEAGLTREQVVRALQRGDVRGTRHGRRYLIEAEDLARWCRVRGMTVTHELEPEQDGVGATPPERPIPQQDLTSSEGGL
jgi:excisionase family DNA binding protein